MPFSSSNPVIVGDATKKSHYDRSFNNGIALKEARLEHPLGGDFQVSVADTAYVPIPGFIVFEIDGTNLSGMTVELHAMCRAATGTGRYRLWNITTGAEVAGSETTFTETSATLKKSSGITLTAGVNTYRLEIRGNGATDFPLVYGAKLVIR